MEKINNLFAPFISAHKESYNTQHVLIRFIEEWKKNLDNNYFIGAVLMNLSKAFDCIPHGLAKLPANGFAQNVLCCVYSYLKDRKQRVSVNYIKSTFEKIISGVSQGSIVGHILFNLFFNDFFYFILFASAYNFEYENTLSCFAKTRENLISILESESEIAIKWFKENYMIVNPGKFQWIIYNKQKRNHTNQIINIVQKKLKWYQKLNFLE